MYINETSDDFLKGRMPAYWSLGFDRSVPALVIKIHQDFMEERNLQLMAGPSEIESSIEDYGVTAFASGADRLQNIGYEKCLKRVVSDSDFFEYQAALNGDRTDIKAIWASLLGLFEILHVPPKHQNYTACEKPQKFRLWDFNGLGGRISQPFAEWIKNRANLEDVNGAMRITWSALPCRKFDESRRRRFGYKWDQRCLILCCENDDAALAINTRDDPAKDIKSLKILNGIKDNEPLSMYLSIALLSGLAALVQLAQKDISLTPSD